MIRTQQFAQLTTLLLVAFAAQPLGSAAEPALQRPAPLGDVPFVPTPPEVVQLMLRLGEVRSGDVVYDLGCGDGRIVIAAVKIPGVRGVCVDIDPARIEDSRINAERAGVASRIRFVEGNLFEVPIEGATVVKKLRPLLSQPRRERRDREPPEALPKRGEHRRRPQPCAGTSVSVGGAP